MSFEPVIRNVARELSYQVPQSHLDDLMQEGRLAVWLRRKALAKLEPDHARRSAAQTARWAMLDYVRKMWPQRGQAGNLMTGSTDELEDFDISGPDSTFAAVEAGELVERIQDCIHASCRRSEGRCTRHAVFALLLEEHEGISIAEQLGLSPETVSLHKTALAKIAAALFWPPAITRGARKPERSSAHRAVA